MPDIRIKDLTTTASTTAADDFFAADGTTNGTRKLSAYSPSFGGNATVTGTLSSAGNLSVTGTSAQIILGQSSGSQLTYLIRPAQAGGAIQMVQDSATINRWLSLGGCDNTGVYSELMRVAGATGNILVTSTTASTSTSSGALVVGGGVGVAKRIYSGEGLDTAGDNATHISFVRNGTISIGPTSAATPKLQVGGGLLLANNSQSVPAYGDVGPQLSVAGAVITDTTSSGTVSRAVVNSIAASALAASSTTTYTQAASLFVAGAPTANANVTITNAYAIYTAGGRINFQGLPTSSAGLQAGTLWNDAGTLKVA